MESAGRDENRSSILATLAEPDEATRVAAAQALRGMRGPAVRYALVGWWIGIKLMQLIVNTNFM